MAIDRAEAARIAALAKLEIPEDELDAVAVQLSAVLEFVATLEELDLTVGDATVLAPTGVPLRSDEPDGRTLEPGQATAGAPEAEDGFFLVPPVVENLAP
jgi:aspartyl-tRNA(Asn)/glutamyl-tRNA(Gln) amidotransferase subunit C